MTTFDLATHPHSPGQERHGRVAIALHWLIPPWPPGLPGWQRLAADTAHHALYAAMVVLPLSGYVGSNFTRYPILLPQRDSTRRARPQAGLARHNDAG